MTQRTGATNETPKDEVYTCLAHHRRRRTIALLDERSAPVSVTELATRIVAEESKCAPEDVSEEETQSVLVELHHTHLPTLAAAGFVTWDDDTGTVAGADGVSLDDPFVTAQLESLEESRDQLLSALAHRRRRLAVSLVSRCETSVTLSELAEAMVARERAMGLENESEMESESESHAVDTLVTKLYHQHLPQLENAGLVAYDHDDGTVTDGEHPDVEPEWFDGTIGNPQRPVLEIAPPQAKL